MPSREPENGERGDVTRLLARLQRDDPDAADALFEHVYDQLHAMARRKRAWRYPGPTLNTTALVHEAYLKLVNTEAVTWKDRAHFFRTAAQAMRHLLVDHARKKSAQKRGGEADRIPFEKTDVGVQARAGDVLALDDALEQLETLDERLGQVVELRFFAGLTVKETAEVLDVSGRTVKRDWRKARAFLYEVLRGDPGS